MKAKSPGRPCKNEVVVKNDKLTLRTQVTFDVKMWWVKIVNIKTGESRLSDPLFVVRAETWQMALAKIEKKFDREQWPKEIYKLEPQIMEFGEMDEDVAYL